MKSTLGAYYLVAVYVMSVVALVGASIFSLIQTLEFIEIALPTLDRLVQVILAVLIQYLPTPFFTYAALAREDGRTKQIMLGAAWLLTVTDIGTNIGWLGEVAPFDWNNLLRSFVTWVLVGGVFCVGIAWAEEAIEKILALLADELIFLYRARGEEPPSWLGSVAKAGHKSFKMATGG